MQTIRQLGDAARAATADLAKEAAIEGIVLTVSTGDYTDNIALRAHTEGKRFGCDMLKLILRVEIENAHPGFIEAVTRDYFIDAIKTLRGMQ